MDDRPEPWGHVKGDDNWSISKYVHTQKFVITTVEELEALLYKMAEFEKPQPCIEALIDAFPPLEGKLVSRCMDGCDATGDFFDQWGFKRSKWRCKDCQLKLCAAGHHVFHLLPQGTPVYTHRWTCCHCGEFRDKD